MLCQALCPGWGSRDEGSCPVLPELTVLGGKVRDEQGSLERERERESRDQDWGAREGLSEEVTCSKVIYCACAWYLPYSS